MPFHSDDDELLRRVQERMRVYAQENLHCDYSDEESIKAAFPMTYAAIQRKKIADAVKAMEVFTPEPKSLMQIFKDICSDISRIFRCKS